MARGFTLTELAVSAAVAGVTAALAGPVMMAPEARRAISLRNMHVIGAAGGSYRLDNDDYLPIEGMYGQRRVEPAGPMQAWCNWSAGGKNNNGWWATSSLLRLYDIEAADRPLNPYAVPGMTFTAPPPPATLPASDPARLTEEAPVFKDPSGMRSHQRQWPAPNPTAITAYDDIGTGYLWNVKWWDTVYPQYGYEEAMDEGTRRMARGEGARPDRFVWFHDQAVDLVINSSSLHFRLTNPYGDVNKGILLMIDGRAGYFEVFPGRQSMSYHTPNFSFAFE